MLRKGRVSRAAWRSWNGDPGLPSPPAGAEASTWISAADQDLLAAVGYGKIAARQVLAKVVPAEQLTEKKPSAVSKAMKRIGLASSGYHPPVPRA